MILGIASIIIGYLLGSIPTAYIITKMRKGIDIRTVDIGNVGGGSVLRQVGIWEGVLVLVVDMAKGAATIYIAQALGVSMLWVFGAGFAAVLGHSYPVYIGFRGGQGVATILGIFWFLTPIAVAILFGIVGIILLVIRRKFPRVLFIIISILTPLLPVFIWIFYRSEIIVYYSLVFILFLLFKNRRRLKEVVAVLKFRRGPEEAEITSRDISPDDN